MSTDLGAPARNTSVHLPLALLALAISVFLFAQIRSASTQNSLLQWQIENAEKNTKDLSTAISQLNTRVTESQKIDGQIEQLYGRVQNILSDLLELSKEDADAKRIADAYGIQRQQPAAPAAGAATTPAPAAAPTPAK